MDATLTRHLEVARCIGCGARSHSAQCADGCADEPLDLVDVDDLAAVASRTEDLEVRVAELRDLARMLASEPPPSWQVAQERARVVLHLSVPDKPEVTIIQGWGCPGCGRVDAPQPCIGVCIRRPALVADAGELREYEERSQELAAADRELSKLARTIATVKPRPGHEEPTTAAMRSRARELLDRFAVQMRDARAMR